MTIRNIGDFGKLNSYGMRNNSFLPGGLAYCLPELMQAAGFEGDYKSAIKAIGILNDVFANTPCFYARGFVVTKILDDGSGYKTDMHPCKLEYCENVRSYAERNCAISGKDSIGIQFVDADDGLNDWIWISFDVLSDKSIMKIALTKEVPCDSETPLESNYSDVVSMYLDAINIVRDWGKPAPVADLCERVSEEENVNYYKSRGISSPSFD